VTEVYDSVFPEAELEIAGRLLASGEFAEVFTGRVKVPNRGTLGTQRKVVFKKWKHNPTVMTREVEMSAPFLNEIALLRTIEKRNYKSRHLGTMQCLIRTTKGVVLSVQPHYELGNLERFLSLNHHGHLPERQAINFIIQLHDMLKELMHAGIGHGDIRPSNICLRQDPVLSEPRLVLVDWKTGVQRLKDLFIGNLSCLRKDCEYQPPEVGLALEECPKVSSKHDEWSLTLIMEQIVSRKPSLFSAVRWETVSTLAERYVWMLGVPKTPIDLSDGIRKAVKTVTGKELVKEEKKEGFMRSSWGRRRKKRELSLSHDFLGQMQLLGQGMFKWNCEDRTGLRRWYKGARNILSLCEDRARDFDKNAGGLKKLNEEMKYSIPEEKSLEKKWRKKKKKGKKKRKTGKKRRSEKRKKKRRK